ncbi:MAG: Gfo/Idh/MocA family oxidoreductase [Chitinophagaceae bacterium]|nr:Gfo/Idh/MocA family oxidoreductase [Chitinophagaceae bacterium]
MLRIGIIGAGQFSKQHVEQLQELPQVEISGIFDKEAGRATEVGTQFGIPARSNFDDLLAHSDAVHVVCSTHAHFEMASQALRLGKHVFIEKPMTATPEQAGELIKMSLEADVKCMVGYNERFNPAFQAMEGRLNRLVFAESHRVTPFTPRTGNISVVLDLMIQDIDLILKLVKSDIRQISATGVRVLGDTPDIANVRLEFNNGCVANLTASRLADREKRSLRLFEQDAYYRLNLLHPEVHRITLAQRSSLHQAHAIQSEKIHIEKHNTLQAQFQCFIDCILNNKPCPTSPQEAYSAMDVAFRIMKKIETQGNP